MAPLAMIAVLLSQCQTMFSLRLLFERGCKLFVFSLSIYLPFDCLNLH